MFLLIKILKKCKQRRIKINLEQSLVLVIKKRTSRLEII